MVLSGLFLLFLSTHQVGTKYRSVTSAYISLYFSEVENAPFLLSFSIELSVWSCSARTPLFCAAGGAGRRSEVNRSRRLLKEM